MLLNLTSFPSKLAVKSSVFLMHVSGPLADFARPSFLFLPLSLKNTAVAAIKRSEDPSPKTAVFPVDIIYKQEEKIIIG